MPVSGVLSSGAGLDIRQIGKRPGRQASEQSKRSDTFDSMSEPSPSPVEAPQTPSDSPSPQAAASDDDYIDYGLPDDLADLLRAAAKPP